MLKYKMRYLRLFDGNSVQTCEEETVHIYTVIFIAKTMFGPDF